MSANALLLIKDVEALRSRHGSSGAYILVAHAIELLLKAYLHHTGESLETLQRTYRHNLERLFADAKQKGLSVPDAEAEALVASINAAIDKAALRYEFYFGELPQAMRLHAFASKLYRAVFTAIQ